MDGLAYLGLIPVFALLVAIGLYNGLISRRNAAQNASASLDANLQKRYDLIPNVVETVRGYMTHERALLENLVQLRNEAQAKAPGEIARLDSLAPAIRQVFAVAENYPQLKAVKQFLQLQATLNEVEEQISASRRAFNASVNEYNNAVESFPSKLVARAFGFVRRDFYNAEETARTAPQLSGRL